MSTAGEETTFLGSERDPTSRRGSAVGASASACASHRSPRWRAAPHDLAGTGRTGALPGLGSVARSAERQRSRRPSPSLAVGSHMQAAGGWQAGAPVGSSGSTRPPAFAGRGAAPISQHPAPAPAGARIGRGVPAPSTHSIPPAREAGVKEENR